MLRHFLVLGFIASSACAGRSPASESPNASASQVERGAALYGEHCASCHGGDGRGTSDAPAVVGPTALPLQAPGGAKRQVAFATAGDVFRWVRVAMPGDAPGSLSDEDYAAILAFALQANGVDMTGVQLDEARADQIRLH